ncbi:MAG TPA: Na+/H+ antiporter subunit E [Bacteroidetes bacterium]|nr:Na+/H+ antiporter subunit E [Bacteroidota bacterium]
MKNLTFSEKLGRFTVSWIFLMLVWIAFTSTFASQELIVGVFTTMVIALLSVRLFTCCTISIFNPVKVFWMIWYLIIFLKALVESNFDVARRVLTPSLPINPGIVKFKTKLQTHYSKMVLANSITLTPGTLTVDVVGDTFYIHWIDVKTTDPEKAFTDIAGQFENILLKIF